MSNKSPEELARELEVLRGKIYTLTLAQRRIEREAEQLAAAIGELSSQHTSLIEPSGQRLGQE